MACPHVAGAAALYLSAHPGSTVKQIKDALLNSSTPLPNLSGKVVSGGKLNVEKLMQ
jgi:subtilisin family serine protease